MSTWSMFLHKNCDCSLQINHFFLFASFKNFILLLWGTPQTKCCWAYLQLWRTWLFCATPRDQSQETRKRSCVLAPKKCSQISLNWVTSKHININFFPSLGIVSNAKSRVNLTNYWCSIPCGSTWWWITFPFLHPKLRFQSPPSSCSIAERYLISAPRKPFWFLGFLRLRSEIEVNQSKQAARISFWTGFSTVHLYWFDWLYCQTVQIYLIVGS